MATAIKARDKVAITLCKCYQYERRRCELCLHDKMTYFVPAIFKVDLQSNPEARRTSIWHRLARICRDKGIDPMHYISMSIAPERPIPEPSQLLEKKWLDSFVKESKKENEWVSLRLWMDKGTAERNFAALRCCGCGPKDAWAEVLVGAQELSPLLRFCVARLIGGKTFLRIAAVFKERALLQYHQFPDAYDAVWKHLAIPEGFREEADRLYGRILEREP